MKKIIIISLMLAAFIGLQAQVTPPSVVFKTPAGVIKSAITHNDTVIAIFTAQGFYNIVAAQVEVKRATGKVGAAASKVIFSGSITGDTYVSLDTLALTDAASASKVFSYTTPKYYYYKIWAKIDSTHTGTITAKYLVRKDFGN
jgi:uncharacterized protein YgbK (DUF1537 family)